MSTVASRQSWFERRTRVALWIAVAEGIIVLFSDFTKWTVVALAIISFVVYYATRETSSSTLRNVAWTFAASQLIATIIVIIAWFFTWAAILAVVVAAIVALMILFRDRR